MRTRTPLLAVCILTLTLASSCGSVLSLARFPEKPQVYGGSRLDLWMLGYARAQSNPFFVFTHYTSCLLDLALSAAADTAFLPVTLPADFLCAPEEPARREQNGEKKSGFAGAAPGRESGKP